MQVNNYSHNQNPVSFGSKRIFPVIIRDMNNKPVKAWFTRLNPSDSVDKEAIKRIDRHWGIYAGYLYSDFINYKRPAYAIEKDSSEDLYNRFLCLATLKFQKKKNEVELLALQSAPISSSKSYTRQYKGAGTALMYGIVRTIEKLKAQSFTLDSAADGFYEKLGMVKREGCMTFIPDEMHNFIKRQKAEWKVLSIKN